MQVSVCQQSVLNVASSVIVTHSGAYFSENYFKAMFSFH